MADGSAIPGSDVTAHAASPAGCSAAARLRDVQSDNDITSHQRAEEQRFDGACRAPQRMANRGRADLVVGRGPITAAHREGAL
jgi:hypothetical protein